MAEKEKLAYTSTMLAEDAARHLEALAQGLRDHVMVIESGDTSVAIDVAREVRLELEAGASQKKSQLELKVTWSAEQGTEIQPPVLKIVPQERYAIDPEQITTPENGHRSPAASAVSPPVEKAPAPRARAAPRASSGGASRTPRRAKPGRRRA